MSDYFYLKFKLLVLTISLVSLSSCFDAGKKKNDAATAFAVTGFAGGSWTGGAIIWAKGPAGQFKSITLIDENDSAIVDLAPGPWVFMAAGWLGTTPADGNVKCGVAQVALQSGDNNVPISLTATGCNNPEFAPAAFINAGTFKPIRFISCHDTTSATAGSNCDATAKGAVRSFKIVFIDNSTGAPIPDFATPCHDETGAPSTTDTTFKIPVGKAGVHPIHTVIEAYPNLSCGGTKKTYVFKDGLINGTTGANTAVVHPFTGRTEIFLEAPRIPIVSAYSAMPGNYVNGGAITPNTPTMGTGGPGPYTFSVTPPLPTGLTLNTTTGAISGTPVVAAPSASYAITATNSAGTSTAFNLTIEVLEPALLTTDNVGYNYGTVANGSTNAQTYTISNGAGRATATGINETGLAAPYILSGGFPGSGGTCTATLAGGASCTIVVDFLPTVTNTYPETITLAYNDGTGATNLNNSISGTSAPPANIAISEVNPYDLGTVTIGATATHIFTLTNSGGVPATGLSEIGLAAPFDFTAASFPGTGGNCTTTLNAGANCNIEIEFAPGGTGLSADTISIQYGNGVSTVTSNRDVQGTGATPAVLTITDGPTYDYGNIVQGTGPINYTFTINNTGGSTATSMAGTGLAAPFQFSGGSYPGGGTCGITLAPAGSCTIIVSYSPSGTGANSDTIEINYNDGAGAAPASTRGVQGTGIASPPTLSIDDVADTEGAGFTFTITSSYALGQNLTVDYATSDGTATAAGSDYTTASGTATITAHNSSTTVAVNTTADAAIEPDETFNITLSNPANATISDGNAEGTIINDDATKIYRSVGPGNSTALATGGGNGMTILGGLATFAVPLPNNVGVGDMIQYDSDNNSTIDSIAMITSRPSATTFTLRTTDGTGAPANLIVADVDWSIFRAYTALADAENGDENTGIDIGLRDFDTWSVGRDLAANSEQWNITCYADAVETGSMSISGWTTSTNEYLHIYTPTLASEVGTSQRHNGITGGFTVQRTGNIPFVISNTAHVRLTGLYFEHINPTNFHATVQVSMDAGDTTAEYWISNNIIKQSGTPGPTNNGIQINGGLTATTTAKISNNVVYNTFNDGIHLLSGVHYVYNNTVRNAGNDGVKQTPNSFVKNTLSDNSTGLDFSGTPDASSDYNASGDVTAAGGNSRTTQTFIFNAPGAGDFTLSGGDTGANGFGMDLSADPNLPVTNDITGTLRSTTGNNDIGADGV